MYLLLSCCPCEGRISGIVDSPNAVATLAIPTAIFDQVRIFPIPPQIKFYVDVCYKLELRGSHKDKSMNQIQHDLLI